MQGFPSTFKFPVSDSEALKQLGNSVAVTAIQDYASAILESLGKNGNAKRTA
jgi:DNA (cytosine-5)-methyltransferase 1